MSSSFVTGLGIWSGILAGIAASKLVERKNFSRLLIIPSFLFSPFFLALLAWKPNPADNTPASGQGPSLKPCSACGANISVVTKSCPQCGHPQVVNTFSETKPTTFEWITAVFIGFTLLSSSFIAISSEFYEPEAASKARTPETPKQQVRNNLPSCSSKEVTDTVFSILKKDLKKEPGLAMIFDIDSSPFTLSLITTTDVGTNNNMCQAQLSVTFNLNRNLQRAQNSNLPDSASTTSNTRETDLKYGIQKTDIGEVKVTVYY